MERVQRNQEHTSEQPSLISSEAGVVLRQTGITILMDDDFTTAFWRQSINRFLNDLDSQNVPFHLHQLNTLNTSTPELNDQLRGFSNTDAPGTIMLVSTCISDAWCSGQIPDALQQLAEKKNVAIVSLFNMRHIRGTALGAGEIRGAFVPTSTPELLSNNTQLSYQKKEGGHLQRIENQIVYGGDSFTSVTPILELNKESMSRYAEILSGKPERSIPAVHFDPATMALSHEENQQQLEVQPQIDPKERVRKFRYFGEEAHKLARTLAAVPLDLDAIEAIREKMHPKATETDFALVALGGILKITGERDGLPMLDFHPGVRNIYLQALPRLEEWHALSIGIAALAEKYPKDSHEGATFRQLAEATNGDDINIVINEITYPWAKAYAPKLAGSELYHELSEHLKTRIGEYERQHQLGQAQMGAEKRAVTVTVEHDHGESVLRRIAQLHSPDFQRYADLESLEGFPAALRAMALFLAEHPGANGFTHDTITKRWGAPMELIEYPTRDVYWRDANVFYRARMEYMNDKERIDGVNPTKISLHAFDTSKLPRDIKQFVGMENRLGAQQLFKYEFGYRQLPHQTVKAGNSSGHIYQTGESFHVETHWGQNRHLITSGERDKYVIPAPRETTERIARITIIAAGIMHKRYEAITQAPLLGQRPPQQQ